MGGDSGTAEFYGVAALIGFDDAFAAQLAKRAGFARRDAVTSSLTAAAGHAEGGLLLAMNALSPKVCLN